jgi:O-antigen ligase
MRPATLPVALALSLAGLAAGLLRPLPATLALAAVAPLLAGLPRAWGESAPVPLAPLVVVSLLAGVLARRQRDGEESALPPAVSRWGGAFLVVAAASALSSSVRGETLYLLLRGGASPVFLNALGMTAGERTREAVVLLAVLVSLWAALDAFGAVVRSERGRERLVLALAAGLSTASAIAVLERFLPVPLTASRWAGMGRFSGLASDPNALGVVVALGAPVLLGLLLVRPGPAAAVAAGLGLLLLLPVLQTSGSRTGLLLLAVAAGAAGVGLVRQGGRARRIALGTGAVAALVLIVVAIVAPRGGPAATGGLLARLGASLSAPNAALLSNHRPMFWGAAFDMLASEPLSGVGLGGFPFEFPVVFERRWGRPAVATDSATNLLLDVAAECGLPALALALGAAVPLLVRVTGAAFDRLGVDPVGRAAGASLAGFALASLTGSHLRFPEVALVVAGVAALLPPALAASPEESSFRPRRLLPLLAGSGVLAALLATAGTAEPSAPFRQGRWTGLHDRLRPRRWTSANAFRRVEPGERRLLLTMANERPDRRGVVMRVRVDDVAAGAVAIPAGPNRLFRVDLPEGARVVRLSFDPVFVPRELGRGDDWRTLGVRLHADGGNVP